MFCFLFSWGPIFSMRRKLLVLSREEININYIISKQVWLTLLALNRSSHRRCSVRKGVLRNFAKSTGKYLCQRLFLNKVAGLRHRCLWHRCFPVNFAKFLRTSFLQNTSGRLLLPKIASFLVLQRNKSWSWTYLKGCC